MEAQRSISGFKICGECWRFVPCKGSPGVTCRVCWKQEKPGETPQKQIYILFWRRLVDWKRKFRNELTFRQGTRCKLGRGCYSVNMPSPSASQQQWSKTDSKVGSADWKFLDLTPVWYLNSVFQAASLCHCSHIPQTTCKLCTFKRTYFTYLLLLYLCEAIPQLPAHRSILLVLPYTDCMIRTS